MEINIDLNALTDLARLAGREIMEVYASDHQVSLKADCSPITLADQRSHEVIVAGLMKKFKGIPIVSEEGEIPDFALRRGWDYFWLIDPLDGTKEFINQTNEFTVNISLIHKDKPIVGIVYAPALDLMYYAQEGHGAFKEAKADDGTLLLRQLKKAVPVCCDRLKVVTSRSHLNCKTKDFVQVLGEKFKAIDFRMIGSSLKICYVADQLADVYPRLGPTMEWDTAAAHAICREVGVDFYALRNNSRQPFLYNKESLLNDSFVVERPGVA